MIKIYAYGRLTDDPKVDYFNDGEKVKCSFTLASNRPFKNSEGGYDSDFLKCVIWGKRAEILANSISKGKRIAITGDYRLRNYTDNNGNEKWITECQIDNFDFVETKKELESSENHNHNTEQQSKHKQEKPDNFSAFGSVIPFDEEIPF